MSRLRVTCSCHLSCSWLVLYAIQQPAALPISLAATEVPTIYDRFGAMSDILDSTYSIIFSLWRLSSKACTIGGI